MNVHIRSSRPLFNSLFVLVLLTLSVGSTLGQKRDWSSLPEEVSSPVKTLCVYKDRMFVGGHFFDAGQQRANFVALWDGSTFHTMENGLHGGWNPFAKDSYVWNDDLYVVGNFDSAGAERCNDIARWDGSAWYPVGTGSDKSIFSITEYNGDLVVCGQFDSIGDIAAQRIARWDGTAWYPLGPGIDGSSVNSLCVYDGKLYASGPFDSVAGIYCKNIAAWDGTSWDSVGPGLRRSNTAMIEWEGQLIVGSMDDALNGDYEPQVHIWDGLSWELFSKQKMMPDLNTFSTYEGKLYCAGGQGTSIPLSIGQNRVAVWNPDLNKWENAGSGINHRTNALCVYKGDLYCGGNFNVDEESPHNYLAKYSDVTGIAGAAAPENTLSVWPNPSTGIQHLSLPKGSDVSYELQDAMGRVVKTGYIGTVHKDQPTTIDLADLPEGMYHYHIRSNEYEYTHKIIKTSD